MVFYANSGPKFWPRPEFGPFFSKKARIRPKFLEQSPTWATNLQNNRSFIICTWFLDFWHLSWLGIIYWSVWTVFWVKLAVFIGNSDPKNQYLEKSRCNHPWIFSQLFDISRGNFFYRVPDICEGQEKTFYPIKSILTYPSIPMRTSLCRNSLFLFAISDKNSGKSIVPVPSASF